MAKNCHLHELVSYLPWFIYIYGCTSPYDGLSNGEKTCETNDHQVVKMTQINFPKKRDGVDVTADDCQTQQSGDDTKERGGNGLNLKKVAVQYSEYLQ